MIDIPRLDRHTPVYLLSRFASGHRPTSLTLERAICGETLTKARTTTVLACRVFEVPLCVTCFPARPLHRPSRRVAEIVDSAATHM